VQIPKFINLAFVQNRWLWFHMLAGGILAHIIPLWTILLLAIGWEVFEYFISDVEKIYGSKRRFFIDAFGDIVGALIVAIIVLY